MSNREAAAASGDERTQFDYLLNAFEHASQADKPAEHDYAAKRRALFAYARDLERRARLSASVAAQPAASGVDALWVEEAKRLSTIAINAESEYAVAAEWKSPFTSDLRLKAGAAISELDAHLSTALGGKRNG